MVEKCWTEGRDRGVNDNGTKPEEIKKKESCKYYNKKNKPNCANKNKLNQLTSSCPVAQSKQQ